jgi:ankyrin repeat protein
MEIPEFEFIGYCEKGELDNAKSSFENHVFEQSVYKRCLKGACKSGQLNIVEWLLTQNPSLIDYTQETFIVACGSGHLGIVKLLLQINPYIHTQNVGLFAMACGSGHLEVSKFLIKININNNEYLNYAFIWACFYGNLECAQLLQQSSFINIHDYDNKAFRCAWAKNHFEIIKWFQSLNPYLYLINYKPDGSYHSYYIRSKREEKIEQIKYVFWLEQENQQNNILQVTPIDLLKKICEYV